MAEERGRQMEHKFEQDRCSASRMMADVVKRENGFI